MPGLPPPSSARARRSYATSGSGFVAKAALKPSPGVVSTAIVVQEPPPAGRRSKVTLTVSAAAVAVSVGVPETAAPGSTSVTVGAVLSIVTARVADVVSLPATSVTTTRSSAGPSAWAVVSRLRR